MWGLLLRPAAAALAFALGLCAARAGGAAADFFAVPDVPAPAYPRPRLADLPAGVRAGCTNWLCAVHHAPTRRGRAPIEYGVSIADPARERAAESLFPLSNRLLRGGFEDLKEPTGEVIYCPECRAAERAWERARAGGGPAGRGRAHAGRFVR